MKRVTLFVALSVFLAATSTVGVSSFTNTPGRLELQAALLLALLGALSDSIGYSLARNAVGSIAFVPYVAAAALAPNWATILIIAAVSLVEGIALRRAAVKTLFNVGQVATSLAVGIALFVAAGGKSLFVAPKFALLPLTFLLAGFLLTNSLLVSGVIAANQNTKVWPVWKTTKASTLIYDVLAIPFVWFFARVYAEYGLIGTVLLVLPLLGARQLYKTNWQLAQANQELLQLMVAAIEARDPYTSGHSQRVSRNARIIAGLLHLNARQTERIAVAALLHDVGKIHEVFAPLLRKAERLTEEETRLMQSHPIKSAELVENVTQLRDVVEPIRHHHECWDGTGYPSQLSGESIPLAARIIMLADTIDAMSTDRPYRKALGAEKVRAEILKNSGTQFDPTICEALLAADALEQLVEHPPVSSGAFPAFGARGRTVRTA